MHAKKRLLYIFCVYAILVVLLKYHFMYVKNHHLTIFKPQAHSIIKNHTTKRENLQQYKQFYCADHPQLVITPTEGLGNRMRALVSAVHLAKLTGRRLSIAWSEMALMSSPPDLPCVQWADAALNQACLALDCHHATQDCVERFNQQDLYSLFPPDAPCIHLTTFTQWGDYLLDNSHTHGALAWVYARVPPGFILQRIASALPTDLHQQAAELRQRMLPPGGGTLISVHIRTHADQYDGGTVREAYHEQLLCVKAVQAHLHARGVTSAVFLESDSTHAKDEAHGLGFQYLTTLDAKAERSDLRATLLAWLLLGEADMLLGTHASSFSKTAALRTGAFLFQLPADAVATNADRRHNYSSLCSRALPSARTHDATFVLVPEPCADLFPGCPAFAVEQARPHR
jgi:hypothetical protein